MNDEMRTLEFARLVTRAGDEIVRLAE